MVSRVSLAGVLQAKPLANVNHAVFSMVFAVRRSLPAFDIQFRCPMSWKERRSGTSALLSSAYFSQQAAVFLPLQLNVGCLAEEAREQSPLHVEDRSD